MKYIDFIQRLGLCVDNYNVIDIVEFCVFKRNS